MNIASNSYVIATDFSSTPGPRFRDEGDFSGEELREDHLRPLVQKSIESKNKVLVDLDGTHGYLTSFLEEAFGGLIRVDKFDLDDLKKVFEFKSNEEPYLIEDIFNYLEEAQDES